MSNPCEVAEYKKGSAIQILAEAEAILTDLPKDYEVTSLIVHDTPYYASSMVELQFKNGMKLSVSVTRPNKNGTL